MSPEKPDLVAAVIGDVVGSRRVVDRGRFHARLVEVLDRANADLHPTDPLHVTAGEEFQGHFATVGAALDATFAIHVALLPEVDTRFGVGWGEVTVLDPHIRTQDGPAWWAAREAIDEVKTLAARAGFRAARTCYRSRASGGPGEDAVAAALLCRDFLLGSLDTRSQRILGGLMEGLAQAAIAEREGISPSAVSQRVRSGGLAVLIAANERLGTMP